MVYFGQKTDWSKNNSFKLQLCNELISLAQEYYGEAQKKENISNWDMFLIVWNWLYKLQ